MIESFRDYVKADELIGDNKYNAAEHGMQDAEKGICIFQLPPVLHLHLKRLFFDINSEKTVKINDR